MHTGVDVQRGKQRIERAGGGVHHKGIIQPLMRDIALLAFDMAVFLVDLRGLREAGLLFMHGLGNQNPRVVFVQLQQQRRAVGHHWNKLLVTHPCRVKQDVITQMPNLIHHGGRCRWCHRRCPAGSPPDGTDAHRVHGRVRLLPPAREDSFLQNSGRQCRR